MTSPIDVLLDDWRNQMTARPSNTHLLVSYHEAAALLEEVARMRANQRTYGKREICENHLYVQCAEHTGAHTFEPCKVKPCPLKQSDVTNG